MAPPAVNLRNRAAPTRDNEEGGDHASAPPSPLVSVRLAGWALGFAATLIGIGIVCVFMEGDSPGRLDAKVPSRTPPQSGVARFWQHLWHGKPGAKPTNITAAKASMLSLVMAACGAHLKPEHLVDLKLEIRWGMGDIQQHRKVQVLLPARALGSTAVPPPAVFELNNLCTMAATRLLKGLNVRCAKDRLFFEIGAGAASLAMAARGMLVLTETLPSQVNALTELQCMNGRRTCVARLLKTKQALTVVQSQQRDIPARQANSSTVFSSTAWAPSTAANTAAICSNTSMWGAFAHSRFKLQAVRTARATVDQQNRVASDRWAAVLQGGKGQVELLHVSQWKSICIRTACHVVSIHAGYDAGKWRRKRQQARGRGHACNILNLGLMWQRQSDNSPAPF